MKRKNRAASASATSPEGKKKKVVSGNEPETSTTASKMVDFTSPKRVVETLLSVANLESFFNETWEKKPHFVKRENGEFYGSLFSKKDFEALLKKEEIQFIEDVNLSRYVEGKTELLNEEGSQVSVKHIKPNGVAIQFHQPDRFKDEVWRLVESLESYFSSLVFVDAFVFHPGSQGLAPQHDDMETFILQTEGKTKWKLFKPLQELSQEPSPDLELGDIGEPTEEFDVEPGDLLYFPRGTIFFPMPIEDKEPATYLALTTFQERSLGNMLTSVLTKAVEKAMESEVEYRRGLPVNLHSFMGSGLHGTETDEDLSEQNGNQKSDKEESDKEAANPRTVLNKTLMKLVQGLECYLSPDKAVDNMLYDFFSGRLPPYGKDIKKGKKKSAPSDKSKIRILHPDHVRVMIGDLSDGYAGSDESDEEMSQAEEEGEEDSEEDESEESEAEEKKNTKKGTKKDKEVKAGKAKETKSKSKKAEKEDYNDEEEDMEDEDEGEGSGDEDDPFDNKEGGDEYILLLHSYKNKRATHMMGDKSSCSTLKFPIRYKGALRQITSQRDEYIAVSSLDLPEKERLSLVKSLWDEGLLDVE